MSQLLKWAKSDTTTLLSITGWADNSGGPSSNERISLFRARTVRNYLVEQGVAANRITFVGKGVDANVKSPDKARRTDVIGIVGTVPAPPVVVPEAPKPQPKPVVDTVAKPKPPLPVVPEPVAAPSCTTTLVLRWVYRLQRPVSPPLPGRRPMAALRPACWRVIVFHPFCLPSWASLSAACVWAPMAGAIFRLWPGWKTIPTKIFTVRYSCTAMPCG